MNRSRLICILERFTTAFGQAAFLNLIVANVGALARRVDRLETKQFFISSQISIATLVDRPDVALMVTELRLKMPEPMSAWTVPTPPLQVFGPQLPEAQSRSSGASNFRRRGIETHFSRWNQSETHDIIVGLALAPSVCNNRVILYTITRNWDRKRQWALRNWHCIVSLSFARLLQHEVWSRLLLQTTTRDVIRA